jgi:drug/metabolite transporter (DMT)-like permease
MRDFYTWATIALVVLSSTAGDVLSAKAMQKIGDFGEIRRRLGTRAVISAVLRSKLFLTAVLFMAIGFFTLEIALSWADVSLVVPASAALTFLTNAMAARIFLNERVDKRRWVAAAFVAGGVALLAQ